ncbi:hypothetical protein ACJJID_15325 [Microbulbifer sp. CnH-101-G]|uniref:hypothetical protein n=1 Tax=Microbulbifer sp. CnH-101-G TaxID=3243393 RepID=UPI00403A5D51
MFYQKKIKLLIISILWLVSHLVSATTLDDLKAHTPTSNKTWAEQWFYNIAVPDVGYFKVSLQTYIAPDFTEPTPRPYIHLAFSPKNGTEVKYDLFLDEVILKHPDNSGEFYYEVPGIILADEAGIWVNHAEFNFSMRWAGDHHHYWHGLNPGQTPFGIIPELPGVGGKWFLYTVGTPVEYSFSDGDRSLIGQGFAQLDKGWFDKESSAGVIYTMGLTDDIYFMFTGAKIGDSSIEMWAGRYISDQYDLIFYPAFKNLSVKRELDPCSGYLKLQMSKLKYKLILEAWANAGSFYRQRFPSDVIFGLGQIYMKSMQANINFSLYKKGSLVESIQVPQGLLEFSGPFTCEGGAG